MKTLIAYSGGETGDVPRLFLVDGDLSHLDDIVLDGHRDSGPEGELHRLLFGDDDTGEGRLKEIDYSKPIKADVIVRCAYVP